MPDFNRTELSAAPVSVAINALLEESSRVNAEQTRGYLGASAIPAHPLRLRDVFDRGHFFERQSREHFERAKFQFAAADKLRFEALDGWLRGHADGIFVAGPKLPDAGYPALWEHKAVNTKGWRALERDGLEKAYPAYAVQVALYQLHLGASDNPAIFTVVNADTCERLHLLVPFDAERARAWTSHAAIIIEATRAGELLPRFTDDQNHWRCRLCGHTGRCWR